ncbi:hypothetical protein TNCV_384861 [Trichonephila clavipes]|nr:hypothetical protein TNCV_384861 [Trichonephila clavipes]
MSSLEQCSNITLCASIEKSSSGTLDMLKKAYGNAPKDFYLFPWLKMILEGHRLVDSDEAIPNATKQMK